MLMIDDVQMTLICLGGFALKCGKALFIIVQCLFELISVSFYLCNIYFCEFLYRAIC